MTHIIFRLGIFSIIAFSPISEAYAAPNANAQCDTNGKQVAAKTPLKSGDKIASKGGITKSEPAKLHKPNETNSKVANQEAKDSLIAAPTEVKCPPKKFDPDKVVGFGARARAKFGKNVSAAIYEARTIKPGTTQDEFVAWLRANPKKYALANEYLAYLRQYGVDRVVNFRELLLGCAINPTRSELIFDVPPKSEWANMVPTLRFLALYVYPAIGPVRLYHGYRNPSANSACESSSPSHPSNMAIDFVPLNLDNPAQIERKMCKVFRTHGRKNNVGMGFYGTGVIHLDTWKLRSWGGDTTGATTPCAP